MGQGDNLTVLYPPGCKEISEDLPQHELIKRLKTLSHTLQSMGQDENAYQEYIPLAGLIAEEHYLSYPNKDVQLLIACCIADVLRVYAPEAPYKQANKVKSLFLFLIKQLAGLKDPKDPAFKRYFYLLENLAYVKSFNMCYELEDSQEIFIKLFKQMFHIVNDEHSMKVKSFMLDVLFPIINESDIVSNELLDDILINILEPAKTQRKNACQLAKDLIVKSSDTLEQYILNFFNHVLILGREEKHLRISQKMYDLIFELNHICPSVLISVLPQLECKLKSHEEEERYRVVGLLARMFSEKESNVAISYRPLWNAFLGRFNDISTKIRQKCVQYSMHFLVHHPLLRDDITETLKMRQHDADELVRYEVVLAIVGTAKKNFSIVAESEQLLEFVKERTLDKKFKIRKEAMCGLAMIYKKHMADEMLSPDARHIRWIRDKILHGYYMSTIEDRLLVERLVNTCLVNYQLPAAKRMAKMLQMFASLDENATKAFVELQKHQMAVRRALSELLAYRTGGEGEGGDLTTRLTAVSRFLADPVKVQEHVRRFYDQLGGDPTMSTLLQTVLSGEVSCSESLEAVTRMLKKLGQPMMSNTYYSCIKMLLERVSNVLVDREALACLVKSVAIAASGNSDETSVEGSGNFAATLPNDIVTEKGLRLLFVLAYVFPAHFLHSDILAQLLSLLQTADKSENPLVSSMVLSVLTYVARYKPIDESHPEFIEELVPICKTLAVSGSAKEAKNAVLCLYANLKHDDAQLTLVFSSLIEKIREQLSLDCPHFRTSIVALGHIVFNVADKFLAPVRTTVSRKIVKELLMRNQTPNTSSSSADTEDWAEEETLSEETRVKLQGIKMMSRWLLGLKNDNVSAQKTFRMLHAFVFNKGDLLQNGALPAWEMSHMRLAAGSAMLKICEQKGVGDQYTYEQFITLSKMMQDECKQVRQGFSLKLHKGLARGVPHKCLPLDFMGFYALAGLETDKTVRNTVKQYMLADIKRRREYIKSITVCGGEEAFSQLIHLMPDYMLVFAVAVLSNNDVFTDIDDVAQLQKVKACLWFVLEPLITRSDTYSFGFYTTLIQEMKNHRNVSRPDDAAINRRMWAVCDLAMVIILSKSVSFKMTEFPSEPRIPPMYFAKPEDASVVNTENYLPEEMQVSAPKKTTKALPGVAGKTQTTATTKRRQEGGADQPGDTKRVRTG